MGEFPILLDTSPLLAEVYCQESYQDNMVDSQSPPYLYRNGDIDLIKRELRKKHGFGHVDNHGRLVFKRGKRTFTYVIRVINGLPPTMLTTA